MKNSLSFIFFLSIVLLGQAQTKTKHTLRKRYITIEDYQKRYNKPLTKKDSLNMIEKDGFKLVLIEDSNDVVKNGKSVPYEYKDSTFLAQYTKIGFTHRNNTYSDSTTSKYWKQPIKLFFDKNIPNKTKKSFVKFAKNIISQVDSLSVLTVNKIEDSNYIIYYSNGYNYESNLNNSKNSDYYIYWKNKGSKIYKGAIKINKDKLFNETLRLNKMKSHFILSLGYFSYNKTLDCENFFSGCYQNEVYLSDFDLEILKYHYSYGICKGTYISTFNEQHKRAKKTLKQYNSKMFFFHSDEKTK